MVYVVLRDRTPPKRHRVGRGAFFGLTGLNRSGVPTVAAQPMTKDLPDRPDRFRCTKCNSAVRLERANDRTLAVACDCNDVSIRVGSALPVGWTL